MAVLTWMGVLLGGSLASILPQEAEPIPITPSENARPSDFMPRVFANMDQDSDGRITLAEYERYNCLTEEVAESDNCWISPSLVAPLVREFEAIDTNDDDVIDTSEREQYLSTLG